MKLMAPDYYPEFGCIAGACRHSCCIGWEIDIDDETLAKYRSVSGAFGKRLNDGIAMNDGQASFRLCEDERCPFLNGDGLCDIILNLGVDALSQICTDHPRYRNFFSDREEIGLGLCCEAAGRLILGRKEKTEWIVLEDDGERDEKDPFEDEILAVREELVSIAQKRELSVDERMEHMLKYAGLSLPETSVGAWAEFYLGLERLDPAWGELLESVRDAKITALDFDETALEQLLVYFLFRHIAGAMDEADLSARAAFAVHAVQMIRSLTTLKYGRYSLDALVETARMYSSEIEYSDENMQAILEAFENA